MAIVPVFRRGSEGQDIAEWNNHASSLWDSFFPRGTLFDPLALMDSFEPFPLWNYTPSSLFSKDAEAVRKTHVDWWESSDAHIIQANLPGVTKEDVEVLVENGRVLQIRGRSRNYSRAGYLSRLCLPENVDPQQLTAELQDGVLTVTIPKLSSASPASEEVRVVEIEE